MTDGAVVERRAASPFETFDRGDAVDLVTEYPLAWLVAGAPGAPASLLPMLPEVDESGALVRLIGHMARHNPLFAALSDAPAAQLLFTGPHAYISPALVSQPGWAPTWNYAQLRIEGRVAFAEDLTGKALEALVGAMEAPSLRPWGIAEMGSRYDVLAREVIAFRVHVERLAGRFKLGQDERPETLREIIAGQGDAALVRWMTRFNRGRL